MSWFDTYPHKIWVSVILEDNKIIDWKVGEHTLNERYFIPNNLNHEEKCFMDGIEPNPYIYATESHSVLCINIKDIIENECNDNGYEDMFDHLNLDGLTEIQDLIDKWIEKQGDADLCYEETNEIVLLDDLIEDIKYQIKIRNLKSTT